MVSTTTTFLLAPANNIDRKQITRSRVSYSCQTCRRRKVKCDKKQPICSGCRKVDEICLYGDDKPTTEDTDPKDNLSDGSRKRHAPDLEARLDQSQLKTVNALQNKLSELTNLLQNLGLSNNNVTSKQSIFGMAGPYSISVSGPHGWKSADSEDTMEGHEAGFDDIMHRMDDLNSLLKSSINSKTHAFLPLFKVADDQQLSTSKSLKHSTAINKVENISLQEGMLAPVGEESNILFRSWLFSIYPIFPLFSPKLVLQKYQAYEAWYCSGMDKGEPNPDPTFMPYLNTIWHGGMLNLSAMALKKWFPWTTSQSNWNEMLGSRILHYLDDKSLAETSPWSLAAALYLQNTAASGQGNLGATLRNSTNIRSVQLQNMHNEKYLATLSEHERELRRRLFWEVHDADVDCAAVSGTPYLLDQQFTNVETMAELKDSILGTQDAKDYIRHLQLSESQPDKADDPYNCQTSSVVSVFYLFARARHILNSAVKKVLRINMNAQPIQAEELSEVRTAILTARQDITAIIARIPTRGVPELDFTPTPMFSGDLDHLDLMASSPTEAEVDQFLHQGQNNSQSSKLHRPVIIAFHKWARIVLSMLMDRAECISYVPFLKNSKSRLWAVGRHCALKVCHGFMRKFISLGTDPELRVFRWVWPCMFQPIHATIILLIDLHDRPHSEEAPRGRAMIDQVFLLSDALPKSHRPEETVLPLREEGEEAWNMIRKLRYKAWQRAGLDPDVLWTEEDQMAVGVGKPLNENDLFIRSLREDIILSHKQLQTQRGFSTNVRAFTGLPGSVVLHPYDLNPSEGLNDLSTQNIELGSNFDTHNLRLRARHDQQLMPFPLHPQPIHHPKQSNETNQGVTDTAEATINIGELIRKIRDTQKSSVATDRPVPMDHLPPTEGRNCDFRTLRSVEIAAIEDLLERNTQQHLIQAQSLPSEFDVDGVNQHIANHSAHLHGNGSLISQDSQSALPYINMSGDQGWPDTSNGFSDQGIAGMDFIPQTTNQSDLSNTDPIFADIEFDWNKWDELFGQPTAYEDLFMENVANFEGLTH